MICSEIVVALLWAQHQVTNVNSVTTKSHSKTFCGVVTEKSDKISKQDNLVMVSLTRSVQGQVVFGQNKMCWVTFCPKTWDFSKFGLGIKSWKLVPGTTPAPIGHREVWFLADLDSAS